MKKTKKQLNCVCDQIRLGTMIKIIGPLFPYWQAKIISFSYALLFKRKTSNFLNLEFVSSKNRTSNLKKILILVHSKPSRSNQVLFPDRNGEFQLYTIFSYQYNPSKAVALVSSSVKVPRLCLIADQTWKNPPSHQKNKHIVDESEMPFCFFLFLF